MRITGRQRLGCGFLGLLLVGGWMACSGGSAHLKRGDELVKAGLHEEALAEFEQAQQAAPGNLEIEDRIAKSRKAVAAGEVEAAKVAAEGKDFAAAAGHLKKAIEFDPAERKHKERLKALADAKVGEGKKALQEKRYDDARALFEEVLKQLPKYLPAKDGMEEIARVHGQTLIDEARSYLLRGLHGNALISLLKLKRLGAAFSESAALEQEAREKLQEAAAFVVGVKPAAVPKKHQAGTAALVQQMRQVKVSKCPAFRVGDADSRASLTLGLEDVGFAQGREPATATIKYQSGKRKVDNPKFLELQGKLKESRDRIGEMEKAIQADGVQIEAIREKFADAGPDDDESALRNRLREAEKALATHRGEKAKHEDLVVRLREELGKTPKKLDEPVFDEAVYDTYKVTRTAAAKIRAVVRMEGTVLASETLMGAASVTDETHPAISKYQLKADPLAFGKADAELSAAAIEDAASKAGELLNDACSRWRTDILSRARQSGTAAKDEALEDFILSLFVEPGPPAPEAVEFIQQHRGFSDIPALLGKNK